MEVKKKKPVKLDSLKSLRDVFKDCLPKIDTTKPGTEPKGVTTVRNPPYRRDRGPRTA